MTLLIAGTPVLQGAAAMLKGPLPGLLSMPLAVFALSSPHLLHWDNRIHYLGHPARRVVRSGRQRAHGGPARHGLGGRCRGRRAGALALLTARVPIKPAALGVIAIFALGQVFCAPAPNYELLLPARLISACGHGVFFGVATIAVSQLVPTERRGSALALMVGGITVANILGLPAGTAIGNAFGWRATFAVIAVISALSVIVVALTLPGRTKGEEEADAPCGCRPGSCCTRRSGSPISPSR